MPAATPKLGGKRADLEEESLGVVIPAHVAVVARLALDQLEGEALESLGVLAFLGVLAPPYPGQLTLDG